MKRILSALLILTCILPSVPKAGAVELSASCAVVMDADSGRVLYEHNAHEKRLIASITKLMTALVALESGHDGKELVTIRPEWAGVEGSSIYLQAGEQVSLETLLYGMLLRSGNDAAMAAAGYCGGSVESFVQQMNEKAAQLGMENSCFANPSGLNDDSHYSTAYDMALLARACLKNEALSKIAATKSITLGTRTFTNHNKLLWRYDGCIGLKTGYTEKAGRTLVTAARRDSMTLICVTLNAPNDWADHTALYDECFARYRHTKLAKAGEPLVRVPVQGSLNPFCVVTVKEAVSAALMEEETADCSIQMEPAMLCAPIQRGTGVGWVIWSLNGTELCRTELVVGQDIYQDESAPETLIDRIQELIQGPRKK